MTLEEYTLQRIVCQKCNHIRITTTNIIDSISKDFKCEVCYNEDGVLHNMNTTKCAECNQVWRSNQAFYHIKGCKAAKEDIGLKIQIDPFKRWYKGNKSIEQKKIDSEIHLAKSQRIFKERAAKERQKPNERADDIVKLLTKISDSLDKKEPEVKVTKINHGAIL